MSRIELLYNNNDKYIYIRFTYSMPLKFVCDLWFHLVFTNINLDDDNEMKWINCSSIRYNDITRPVKYTHCASTFSYTCIIHHLHIHTQLYATITHTNINTRTHAHTSTIKDFYTIPTVFDCIFRFLIYSIYFVICLKIAVCKIFTKPKVADNLPWH